MKRRAREAGGPRKMLLGVAFGSPFILQLIALVAFPLLATFFYSFTNFNLFQDPEWVGSANYDKLFADPKFWKSVGNTAFFTLIGVPVFLVLALIGAHILNLPVRGQAVWRALVYLPSIVPVVVGAYLWKWMFNGTYGFVNYGLSIFGLPLPNWLVDPLMTKPATLILIAWTVGGTTLIYLAGLRDIPIELYEAASIDGAGPWRRFWKITWPMLTPITLFQTIILLVAQVQVFNQPLLIIQEKGFTQNIGGPDNSLLTLTMYLFESAFTFLDMGYASAMATVLFFATLLITAGVLVSTRWWVTYER